MLEENKGEELPLVTRQLIEYVESGGVKHHELAREMGVHRSYISAIFRGRRRVSAKMDTRIRQAVRTVAARRARNVGLVVKDPEGQK